MSAHVTIRWIDSWHSLAREYIEEIRSWRKAEEWHLHNVYFAEQSRQDEKNLQKFKVQTRLLHQRIQAYHPHLDANPIYQVYQVIADWFEFQKPDKVTSQRSLNESFRKAEFTLEALQGIELKKLAKWKEQKSPAKGTTEVEKAEVMHVPKLPALKSHDRQMWQLSLLDGMTQSKIAEKINEQHGTNYTQARVSEGIKRARAHADASGLTEKTAKLTEKTKPPISTDPAKLDLGKRRDGRAFHAVEKAKQMAKEQ